jgi:hypothetical protein
MAQLLLEVKKKMDISGIVTYSLYVDGELSKESNDISEIKSITQTIKDAFNKGEFNEVTIYSETLDNKDVKTDASLDIAASPVIEKPI